MARQPSEVWKSYCLDLPGFFLSEVFIQKAELQKERVLRFFYLNIYCIKNAQIV